MDDTCDDDDDADADDVDWMRVNRLHDLREGNREACWLLRAEMTVKVKRESRCIWMCSNTSRRLMMRQA